MFPTKSIPINRTRSHILALLLAFATAAQAQVQRTFFGCKFGDTQQTVLDSLGTRYFHIVSCEDAIVLEGKKKPITYNGVEWNYVCLNFFDNQFFTISFSNNETNCKRHRLRADYTLMRNRFAGYFKDNLLYNLDEGIRIHDGFTGVYCHMDCVDKEGNRAPLETGTLRLFLTYTDEKIDQVKRTLEE